MFLVRANVSKMLYLPWRIGFHSQFGMLCVPCCEKLVPMMHQLVRQVIFRHKQISMLLKTLYGCWVRMSAYTRSTPLARAFLLVSLDHSFSAQVWATPWVCCVGITQRNMYSQYQILLLLKSFPNRHIALSLGKFKQLELPRDVLVEQLRPHCRMFYVRKTTQ